MLLCVPFVMTFDRLRASVGDLLMCPPQVLNSTLPLEVRRSGTATQETLAVARHRLVVQMLSG
jgi:hypothetical protein